MNVVAEITGIPNVADGVFQIVQCAQDHNIAAFPQRAPYLAWRARAVSAYYHAIASRRQQIAS